MSATKMAAAVTTQQVPIDEQIRKRAHELYLKRGDQPGSEVDDWLQAEREVLQRQQQPAAKKR